MKWGGLVVPRTIMLLGASPIFAPLISWARENGVAATVITSPSQAAELAGLDVQPRAVERLDEEIWKLIPPLGEPFVAISFGARWIFSEAQLCGAHAFAGRLVNAHGTRLPIDRGGGGFSWRIMRGDRIGCLLLHKVDPGIDTGPIVASEEYVIPRALQTPGEIGTDYERRQLPFVISYLERGAPMDALAQPTYSSTYYPRLNTPTHAWIDWSWGPQEIDRFILAFDDPYPGARTYWRDRVVILRRCQLHYGEVPHHPFQSGLVVRNNGRWLTIALTDGATLIVERLTDEGGADLIGSIKEGDRLFTQAEILERARRERISVGPTGSRTR